MKAILKSLDDGHKEVELNIGKTTLGRGALLDVCHVILLSCWCRCHCCVRYVCLSVSMCERDVCVVVVVVKQLLIL